jgi:hypothetical protein
MQGAGERQKNQGCSAPPQNDQKTYNTRVDQNFWHFEKQSVEIIYIYTQGM